MCGFELIHGLAALDGWFADSRSGQLRVLVGVERHHLLGCALRVGVGQFDGGSVYGEAEYPLESFLFKCHNDRFLEL